MKITVYTIKDCAFSKQEKEYLTLHTLQFEEKDLESNKDFLTEMLAVSNNFAGTPVTKIEKDDGTIVVLKGFTPTEFDTALGFAPTAPATTPAPEEKPVDSPKTEVPTTPVETTPPAPVSTPTEPVVTPETPKVEEPLNDVLGKLETNMADTAPTNGVPVDQTPPVPPTPLTDEVSSTGVASAPSVPDFPGK